jgi:hypothetical protein
MRGCGPPAQELKPTVASHTAASAAGLATAPYPVLKVS